MKKIAHINKKNCVACGSCIKKCPRNTISIKRGMYAQIGENCIGCGLCSKVCPGDFIKLKEKKIA